MGGEVQISEKPKGIPEAHELIYDWNLEGEPDFPPGSRVGLVDETLRDGLQSPSVRNPTIQKKLEILHLMADLGVEGVDIGLPGAGGTAVEHTLRLAREIVEADLPLEPYAAARTLAADIQPIAEISEAVGRPLEVAAFMGSSQIRRYAEDWDLELLVSRTVDAVDFAVSHGLPVMYVTEDTTRAHPETLRTLYSAALDHGATRLCVADTVGHATPRGAEAIVRYVRGLIEERGADATIDWHGHRDRGLSVPNALAAFRAGARRAHGTALGIGERVGNAPLDLLLVNLKLMGLLDVDLSRLKEYCQLVADATGVPVPPNYPVVGSDAFRTGTGVHAAAVIKAKKKGDDWLADRIYSGVPAGEFGASQEIEIGPVSGVSNVIYWLETRGYEATPDRVERIFNLAKGSDRVLTEEEVLAALEES